MFQAIETVIEVIAFLGEITGATEFFQKIGRWWRGERE
jgi:hypothetical protein